MGAAVIHGTGTLLKGTEACWQIAKHHAVAESTTSLIS
jgi:hypothetical protein